MPVITLPDGTKKAFKENITIDDLSNSIGSGLAKATVAGYRNGLALSSSLKRAVQDGLE